MRFEYDAKKSELNREKHGIDFEEAQILWSDDNAISIPAKSDTEERWALVARHRDVYWTAFYTRRNKATRLISVRRSRENEKRIYDES